MSWVTFGVSGSKGGVDNGDIAATHHQPPFHVPRCLEPLLVGRNERHPAGRTSNCLLHRLTNSGLPFRLGEHDAIEAEQLTD